MFSHCAVSGSTPSVCVSTRARIRPNGVGTKGRKLCRREVIHTNQSKKVNGDAVCVHAQDQLGVFESIYRFSWYTVNIRLHAECVDIRTRRDVWYSFVYISK